MKQHFGKLILLLACLLFFLPACQLGSALTSQATEPANSPEDIANAVQATLAAEDQDDTPLSESTAAAQPAEALSQNELKEKWQTLIISSAFLSGVCTSAQDTIEKQKTGELSESALSNLVYEIEFVLDTADKTLREWTPVPGTEAYQEDLSNRWNTLNNLVQQWTAGEITPEVAGSEFERECQAVELKIKQLGETASAEGITDETLQAIGAELNQTLENLTGELEAARPVNDEPGMSRKNPYSSGQVASAPAWDLQVLEIKQGEEAWQMIQAANSFNEPAPDGYQYLLVRIKAKNTSTAVEEHSIDATSFGVTGSSLVLHNFFTVVTPEPALNAKLFPGGETEGWLTLLALQNETNLILVYKDLADFSDDGARFIALDEGASIAVPDDLAGIQPTELGVTRETAAPKGQTVVTEDWEVTVLDMKRGEEAWQMIQEGSPYTEAAPDGMEYALAMVKVRYIGSANMAEYIGRASFKATGSSNTMYDFPWIIAPEPDLETHLFPGGQAQGWVPILVGKGEKDLILVYDQYMGFDDEQRRYLSLE